MNIKINGDDWNYSGDSITYQDVVLKARNGVVEPGGMAVTYHWHGDGDNHRQGILSPVSKPIKPEEGMTFNAVYIP